MSLDENLQARYGNAAPGILPGDVIDLLLSHRTWRRFEDRPLAPGTLETLIAAGQSAASSSNLHSWSVVAVEDAERRKTLMEIGAGQPQIGEAPLTLCFVADTARLAEVARLNGRAHEALDYLEHFLVAAIDCALAAQNVCVAAEAMGLGTCYLGVLRNQPERLAEFLRLPPRAAVVFGLSIGHPDHSRPARIKPRLAQSSVLHRETYSLDGAVAPVPDYETLLAAFNSAERNGQPRWGLRSAGRVETREILDGRDELLDALRRLGFPLR